MLSQKLHDAMNAQVPGVSREVKVKSGRYNQHVSTGALLIEVGNNRNTLQEALAACPVIAEALGYEEETKALLTPGGRIYEHRFGDFAT